MSWTGSNAYAFNRTTVNQSAPTASGVYALFNQGKWIYFGESVNIRDRLLQHIDNETNACITLAYPGLFAFELVAGQQARVARQDQLIREFWHLGLCNKRLG